MALAMRGRVAELAEGWSRKDYDLDFGVGIAQGHATLGQDRVRRPFGLHRDRQRHEPRGAVVRRGAAAADPHQPARLLGDRGHRRRRLARRAEPARVLEAGARLQRRRARRGAREGVTELAESAPRLSDLSEHERSARFARLQERLVPLWTAMRLNQPGESIVVVPSITPDATQTRHGPAGARGAHAVPAVPAAQAADAGDLRDRASGARERGRVLPRAAAGRHPPAGPQPSAHGRDARRLGALAGGEAARAPARAGGDPRADPGPGAQPSRAVRDVRARARPRADARHPALRRRSGAPALRHQDRLPAAVRRGRGPAPDRLREPPRRRRRRRRAGADAGGRSRPSRARSSSSTTGSPAAATRSSTCATCPRPARPTSGPNWPPAGGDGLRARRHPPGPVLRPAGAGRWDRRGARGRRRAQEPERAAARDTAGRGRAALHP